MCAEVAQNEPFTPELHDSALRAWLNVSYRVLNLGLQPGAAPLVGTLVSGAGAGAAAWDYGESKGAGGIALRRVGLYSLEILVGDVIIRASVRRDRVCYCAHDTVPALDRAHDSRACFKLQSPAAKRLR